MTPEDEVKIRAILEEALRGGPKPHDTVRVFGLLKVPGAVQYAMRHLGFTVEKELPAGRKPGDVVREMCEDLGPLVLELEPKPAQPTNSNIPKGTPPHTPVPSEPTPELDPDYLDQFGWKSFKSGNGAWITLDTKGAKALADAIVKAGGSIVIGSFRYKISRGEDRDFINRYPVQEATRG